MRKIDLIRLPAELSPQLRSNFIHYFFDIGWWGLYAGATVAFLTIYAARLGATPQQIGLLTAVPALLSISLSLPGGWIIRRISARRASVWGAFVSRGLLVLYALLPFFFNEQQQVTAILVIATLIAAPAVLVNISFNQFLMESVPSEWRGLVVSTRNATFSIVSFLVTMISGQILTHLAFPRNYQVVFFIGFVGAVMTAYHISRIQPVAGPNGDAAPIIPPVPGSVEKGRHPWRRLLPHVDEQWRHYIRLLALFFLFSAVNSMVNPLVPDMLVHTLKLSDGLISLGTALNSLVYFLISLVIARIIRRTSNRGGTALGAALIAMQAILLALAQSPWLYLLSTVLGGLGTGMLGTAQFNYHLENVPEADRPVWLSWNYLLGNIALLLGALAGPLLARVTGVPLALGLFGALRLIMGLIFLKFG